MLPWPNHPLCSYSLITIEDFKKSVPFTEMAYFHIWSSMKVLFSRKRNWNLSTSYSNGFFHASLVSIISRRKCDRLLNGYCTTANSWKQLWFKQTSDNSKRTLSWKLRERGQRMRVLEGSHRGKVLWNKIGIPSSPVDLRCSFSTW